MNNPEEYEDDRHGSKECVPEPENQVDLLIDDVLGEDTETIVSLRGGQNVTK